MVSNDVGMGSVGTNCMSQADSSSGDESAKTVRPACQHESIHEGWEDVHIQMAPSSRMSVEKDLLEQSRTTVKIELSKEIKSVQKLTLQEAFGSLFIETIALRVLKKKA